MTEIGTIEGLIQMIVPLAVCCVPIVLAVAAVIVLLVIVGRRRPKAEPKEARPRQAAAVVETRPAAETKPAPAAEPAVKPCSSCGGDNPADNAFCEYCGASLAEE